MLIEARNVWKPRWLTSDRLKEFREPPDLFGELPAYFQHSPDHFSDPSNP